MRVPGDHEGFADAGLERRRRDVCALELLDASYRAYERGLFRASRRLAGRARGAAPDTVAGITAGMMAGVAPSPERDPQRWAEYLGAQRDGLARAEAEAGN